jgi:isoquinoline 1-oxidoreductase
MMTRRDFFAALGAGIVVWVVDDADAQESGGGGRRGMNQRMPEAVSAWLHIGEAGAITAFTGKVEVGQNARTSLTAAVAEELRAPVASITMIMGDTGLTPFDMGTFGSRTTPTMWPQLRKAAAEAREMLIELASQRWMVDRASITVAGGRVTAGSHSANFGELTKGQKLSRSIPASEALTPAGEWKVAGTSVPKVGGREIVTGAHRYPYDIRRPGMLYGRILYPPSFGATLVSLDVSAAEAIPGVKAMRAVLKEPRDGFGADVVGVVAPDPETAAKALAALRAEWKPLDGQADSKGVFAHYKKTAEGGYVSNPQLIPYTVAYIAHTPLEPRAAVAEWGGDGRLTVWTGTQRPFGVRSELSGQFGLAEDRVQVLMPDTGSGYGGKHNGDAALEAALLAKVAGKPVKRNWTREDELTWAYFRPGGLVEVGGRLNPDGTLASWEFHNYNSGGSGLGTPYYVPAKIEKFHPADSPQRQGSYRGLAATANHFVRESYMDELAHSAGMDPLEFRLRNCRDDRLRAVIVAAADRFGWKTRKKAAGRGFGISAGFEKGGYVAGCCEIAVTNGAVKVLRFVEAFECGAVVNPEQLRNQVEGSIAMGLGGALFEHIDFADGRILTNRLSRYRVPRFADMPAIETVLVDRKDLVSAGAGETPIVAVAPAVGNAIFDATGQRIRSLPMVPAGLPPAAPGATPSAELRVP